ncbi:protein unc-45 homolog B [Lingula anatina]|uniref:Protein unc-45 homolog B n=1 Tax=Lingula anatina TaxID=7574 RepID=A0A1S3H0P0_LINAN|nr:protein unc-45 homolog B [Lingula anatina]|eukprot:XP_013379041.1 protein unc-45 homolog B [Lingula anatina]
MVLIDEVPDFVTLKEEGNKYFTSGQYDAAISTYTKALEESDAKPQDKGVLYKNRAACYLKLEKYEEACADATQALEIIPNDPKALFRRCQCYENLGKIEDAYKDAKQLLYVEPKNKAIQPVLRKLNALLQDKLKEQNSTDNKVTQMFKLAFGEGDDKEKREQAINNLIVLAREEAGAGRIMQSGAVTNLNKLLDSSNPVIVVGSLRLLACLAKENRKRACAIQDEISTNRLFSLMGIDDSDISSAVGHLVSTLITAITELEKFKASRQKHEDLVKKEGPQGKGRHPPLTLEEEYANRSDALMHCAIKNINNGKFSACGRDSVLELLIKFVTRQDGIDWGIKFLETDGITRILEVAGTIPALSYTVMKISENTRMNCSVLLSKIYDEFISDKRRDQYREQVSQYFCDQFGDTRHIDYQMEAITAISALLQGPYDIGNTILGTQGVLEIMLALANSPDPLHQKISVEALVHATSKKDKCSGIVKQAVPILKKLYQSENDNIKVRALVGLCKLGSFGGTDASAKSLAEGSTQALAKACRKFLNNPMKDVDLRKWACEGLAFLTLDADVKQDLVEDTAALQSLIDLAKVSDKSVLYPAATVFVNLTNSYEKKEIIPELLELAKYAKHHIPEEHAKDKPEFVKERIAKLVKAGMVNALVAFSKTDSHSSRELLSRVFLAVVEETEYRGLVVQQGGAKSLIPLANEGTDVGKTCAAQALAKIAIVMNPEVAFPGQRCLEVVRPILQLVHVEKTALQNFEALLALTNLASLNDSVRRRILKEGGFPSIEFYIYEDHELLRRASAECLCNLVMSEEVAKMYMGENDKVKLLVLYCASDELQEDVALIQACLGTLAILSSRKVICEKIMKVKDWSDVLGGIAAQDNPELKHRALHIIMNMIESGKDIAEKVVQTKLLEVLLVLEQTVGSPTKENEKIHHCIRTSLDRLIEYKLIQPTQ